MTGTPNPGFSRYAWAVVVWNLFVIIWGAAVRATGSGAGCGSHWPLCNGEVVPRAPEIATVIEFTHRVTSGLALLSVLALVYFAWRSFPRGHLARKTSVWALVLILIEALLGAGLVLLEYVEQNRSFGRAIYLAAHLTNTLLLVAALVSAAWFGRRHSPRWTGLTGQWRAALFAALAAGATGAVAALGDTVFPATSMVAGLNAEFASDAPALLRLRLVHPFVAAATGVFLAWIGLRLARGSNSTVSRRAGALLASLVVVQFIAGAADVLLLAPVWLQLVHLLLANALWIVLVACILDDRTHESPAP